MNTRSPVPTGSPIPSTSVSGQRQPIADALHSAALAVSSAGGATVFQELVRYLAAMLETDLAFIATHSEHDPCKLQMLALSIDGQIRENFAYPMPGTPCETVVGQEFRFYPERLGALFPLDADFRAMGLESYAGYPLNDQASGALGLIAVVSRRPMRDPGMIESVLKIFAVRAVAELERQHAEDALRVSEASYRELFDAGEDAVFVHEWDTGAVLDVNPRACETYGYSREEMKRISITDISSGEYPYTAEEAAKLIAQAKAGQPVQFEWHRRNRDGTLHWDHVVLKPAVIAGQRRILAFTREITALKLREQALLSSEEQYRSIFNVSADGLLLRDATFRVVDVNPAFLAMTGYTREEVIGAQRVLTLPVGQMGHARELQRRALGGEQVHLEGKGVRKDGTAYDCEINLVPMRYRGEPHVLGVVRDITSRKQAEAERLQLEGQLRQAQKMEAIGHLAGGIAHDFNNLLTSIMGYVVLAAEREAATGDAKLSRFLEQARLSCVRARDLTQQMLTFSRGKRGDPRPLSLPPLVRESVKLLRSSLPSSVEMEVDLDRDTPAVRLDPVQIDQVLLNLCINARDAMNGAGLIRLSVSSAHGVAGVCASCRKPVAGDFVELSVADSGCGIDGDVLERMFEPFYTTKEVGKGSGMGLATVHGVVHEHDGHLLVETAPGRGARFRVLFPPLQAAECCTSTDAGSARGYAVPRDVLRGRVLVVDDEESVGEFMRDLLETWSLDVTVVGRPEHALEVFAQDPQRFDMVITDQTMPRITGVDLARQLRGMRADIPVLLCTGYSDGIAADAVRDAGIGAMLDKPVQPEILFAMLRNYLPHHQYVGTNTRVV